MLHTVKIVSIMLLLAIGTITGGQTPDPDGYPVRFSYHGSPELPDGIAFHLTLNLLNHDVENGDMEDAVWWVVDEMKLPTDQAEAFVNQAVTMLQDIAADIKKANANLACKDGVPVAYNEDVYAVLQELRLYRLVRCFGIVPACFYLYATMPQYATEYGLLL